MIPAQQRFPTAALFRQNFDFRLPQRPWYRPATEAGGP